MTLSAFIALTRLTQPIGIWLLLWPTLWALVLASEGIPSWQYLWVFCAGVVLMRSAGCAINDYADRHIDGKVARSKTRPLVSGMMTPKAALFVAAGLASMAFFIAVIGLPTVALYYTPIAFLLAWLYPFTKRFFKLPQFFLGLAFASAVPIAFVSVQLEFNFALIIPILGVVVIWALIYDTIYALIDFDDDIQLKVNSAAILFGSHVLTCLIIMQVVLIGLLVFVGFIFALSWGYFIALVSISLMMIKQYQQIKTFNKQLLLVAFKATHWYQLMICLGTLIDFLF